MTPAARPQLLSIHQRPLRPQAASYLLPMTWPLKWFAVFALAHAPLGILFYNAKYLGVVHAYAVFAIGMYMAWDRKRPLEQTIYPLMYLAGVEVLWRMAEIPIFWEFGKYGATLIIATALIRRGFTKLPVPAAAYFLLLMPACLPTLLNNDWTGARASLSFNMSGPLALAAACWLFSYVRVTSDEVKRLLLMAMIPIVSVAVTTLFYTVTADEITFGTESNFATSGGFGPNQVSAMLGMGVFFAGTIYLLFKNELREVVPLLALLLLFSMQSVMTFSRGGMYTAIGSIAVVLLFQLRYLNKTIGRMLPIFLLAAVFLILVFPYLNEFTGGNLQTRFEETDTTRRLDIVGSDLQIFSEFPILGIGVGEATHYRAKYLDYRAPSHTELSRLISEHGSLGILALLALFAASLINLFRSNVPIHAALVGGVITWSMLFMLNSGMRLAAPSIIFGISFIAIIAKRRPARPAAIATASRGISRPHLQERPIFRK